MKPYITETKERVISMESILTSIKKLLGIGEDYEEFDQDIIIHINTVLVALTQMGIGPEEGFTISDRTALWSDFIPDNMVKVENVKTYVYLKVKMVFDPPASSAVAEAINRNASELEWRLTNHL